MRTSRITTAWLSLAALATMTARPSPAGAQLGVSSVTSVNDLIGEGVQAGPNIAPPEPRHRGKPRADAAQRLRYWNEIAIDTSALDHTPPGPDERRRYGEQAGPTRTSRALAIVHVAIFEAVNAIGGTYRSYVGLPPVTQNTSLDAAIAQSAHDALVGVYPSQADILQRLLEDDLSAINGPAAAIGRGIALGQAAAAAILKLRTDDGSNHKEPVVGVDFQPREGIGFWRPDPTPGASKLALGARWPEVRPFVMASASQFRRPPAPSLTSPAYAEAFQEVKSLGGEGPDTKRTAEQTEIGIFWAYDGTPFLGTPPRLYNQIAVQIAQERNTNVFALARLLALMNVAMADAAIASWETKFEYQVWRPITAIRAAADDGNPATEPDPTFQPLGAPSSNLLGPNYTPPFPAYTSGHATFGGTVFQILRRFYGTDRISFRFQSDEFNGITRDNRGNVRPRRSRAFGTLGAAEEENGQSRIYLGIHWSFDKTQGIRQGNRLANYVFRNAFVRVATSQLDPGDPAPDATVDLSE
jgi:membrane-associated phospholipid phosphatase